MQLEVLVNLFDIDSEAEWGAALLKLASELGYEYALFGVVPDKALQIDTALLVTNYPHEWLRTYEQQQLHKVDPIVSHCLTSSLPIVWKPEHFIGKARGEFYEQACGHGLRSGVSLPMHGINNEVGVLSMVSSDTEREVGGHRTEALPAISLLRDYALESSRKFMSRSNKPTENFKLTTSELECLKWVSNGKSSWEISRILSRSEATINFHIANIMKKFGVQTRQQAVIKSIRIGIITLT